MVEGHVLSNAQIRDLKAYILVRPTVNDQSNALNLTGFVSLDRGQLSVHYQSLVFDSFPISDSFQRRIDFVYRKRKHYTNCIISASF